MQLAVKMFLGIIGTATLLAASYGVWVAIWSSQRNQVTAARLQGLVPVAVNLDEYVGLWYEHRRINSWFEPEDLINVTARYDKKGDKINVRNSGTRSSTGRAEVAEGTAVSTNMPGVLDVSFFPGTSGLYVVIGLQTDYAIVASPSREYLWLLGRKKEAPSAETVAWFTRTAEANGYPTGLPGVVSVSQG
jgi:apolipoprotein D and lipocalin family protein